MSTNKAIAKSASVLGFATLCSRVLGLLRNIVIANFFGTGIIAEAFVVAWRIPNLLRDLIAEGATNSAFVPVLSEYDTHYGRATFWKAAQALFNIVFIVLLALTLLGIMFSPWIVRLIAFGFRSDPEKLNIAVDLTQILFPYLIFIGLAAYGMGVLNTLRHFSTPAFGPAILNLMIISSIIIFGGNVFGLTFGILLGGLLQVVIQMPALIKHGFRLGGQFNFKHPAVKKIGKLLMPRALGAGIYQINILVSTMLASFSNIVGAGAVSALFYAHTFVRLPLGVFGVSISQAALPTMSVHFTKGKIAELKDVIFFSLKAVCLVTVPATVGLMVLNNPIITVVYERGAFSSYSAMITADALFFYSIGLVSYGMIKIFVNAFYSMQNTLVPAKTAFVSLLVNIALGLILMFPLKVGGLALATSLAATLNCILLYLMLTRRIGFLTKPGFRLFILKVIIASLLMGLLSYVSWRHLTNINSILALIVSIIVGMGTYVIFCFMLRITELNSLIKWMLRRK